MDASVADCCEGAVCVTEKCGYIDHQTAASIDGLPPSHPLTLADPLPQSPSYNDNASEEIGVAGVGKLPGLEQGRPNYTLQGRANWCAGMRTLTIPAVVRIDPSSNRTKAPP